jgi:hypothetical protein
LSASPTAVASPSVAGCGRDGHAASRGLDRRTAVSVKNLPELWAIGAVSIAGVFGSQNDSQR